MRSFHGKVPSTKGGPGRLSLRGKTVPSQARPTGPCVTLRLKSEDLLRSKNSVSFGVGIGPSGEVGGDEVEGGWTPKKVDLRFGVRLLDSRILVLVRG